MTKNDIHRQGYDQAEVVDIKTACQLVAASESTIRRMLRTGRLEAMKKRVSGRTKVVFDRRELLAAFGASELPDQGPGSVVRLPSHASVRERGRQISHDRVPEQPELAKLLQAELGKKEHELAGLRDELRALQVRLEEERVEVRRLNARLDDKKGSE